MILNHRFELGVEIGRGGAAVVYKAWDTTLRVDRAVKLLSPSISGHKASRERLQREARVMAAIRHPSILTVYDAGFAEGRWFIVTEYMEGGALAQRLDRSGPLEAALAVSIVLELLAGLSAAHAHGVVHRDIKPANILFTAAGRPALADFGICAHLDSPTTERSALGTTVYMAPEQRRPGAVPDVAGDIYGMGATLYEALTGVSPAGVFELPEGSPRLAHLPRALREVVRRATRFVPAERFPSAEAMAEALRACGLSEEAERAPGLDGWGRGALREQMVALREGLRRLRGGDGDAEGGLREVAGALADSGVSVGFSAISEAATSVKEAAAEELARQVELLLQELGRSAHDQTTPDVSTHLLGVPDRARQELVRLALRDKADVIRGAATLEELSQLMQSSAPQLLVFDLDAFGLTGIEWLREALSAPSPSTPAVLGVCESDQLAALALAVGVERVLTGKLDPVRLSRSAKLLLSGPQLSAAATERSQAQRLLAALVAGQGRGGRASLGWVQLRGCDKDPERSPRQLSAAIGEALPAGCTVSAWGVDALVVLMPRRTCAEAAPLMRAALERVAQDLVGEAPSAGVVAISSATTGELLELAARAALQGGPGEVRIAETAEALPLRRVLVADDDPDIHALVKAVIASDGLEVVHARDGVEAVALAQAIGPALIILDLQMPRSTGFEVLGALRKLPGLEDVPVMMLTADDDEEQMVIGLELGADDYVVKPFRPAELRARVRRMLR